jgi:hypothetical protein
MSPIAKNVVPNGDAGIGRGSPRASLADALAGQRRSVGGSTIPVAAALLLRLARLIGAASDVVATFPELHAAAVLEIDALATFARSETVSVPRVTARATARSSHSSSRPLGQGPTGRNVG